MIRQKLTTLCVLLIVSVAALAEIPAGYYYQANGKSGFELLDALNNICSRGSFLGYGSGEGYTWQGFYYTDRDEADNRMRDMYSNNAYYQTSFAAVEGMHIEHSLPKSWWGGLENYAYRDLHHLFPADGTTNITKNNLPLGETLAPTFDNGVSKIGPNSFPNAEGNCFEPADEYKGDFARAYFYIATTYNELATLWQSPMMECNTYPVWNSWALDLLLQWHRADPVSQKELDRQEAVYQIQHNRNPYIDYPDLIEHIWGNNMQIPFTFPTDNRPFITTINHWTKINIPAAMIGTDVTRTINVEGYNFTSSLNVSLTNNTTGILLSTNTFTPSELSNAATLTITFSSNTTSTLTDTLTLTAQDFNTIKIPLEANFTDQFMLTSAEATSPTEAFIEWMPINGATTYNVTLYRGYRTNASNLFISGYYEGTSYDKVLALYNGTGSTIDLSHYSIKKQSNGTGAFTSTWQLSGTLAHGSVCIIANSQASDAIKAVATLICPSSDKDNAMNFNGNDAMALYHNNLLIDIIGEDGNSAMWGENTTFQRLNDINAPSTLCNWDEWQTLPISDITPITAHSVAPIVEDPAPTTYTTTATQYTLSNLTPSTLYTVSVTTTTANTANSISFRTAALQTPEAYEASDITDHSFIAHWEQMPSAEGFQIDIFIDGENEETIVNETFDNIGSNGKPLPVGWTGTASGNYTTAASSGNNPNSICLKNNGEWLCTPLTTGNIETIGFMYRYPSADNVSYTLVYKITANDVPIRIDSIPATNKNKNTVQYSTAELGTDCYALKIEYHKVAGNIAIDDFHYSYQATTTELFKNIYTNNLDNALIDELSPLTTYRYTITAIHSYNTEYEVNSPASNSITVTTLAKGTGTDITTPSQHNFFVTTNANNITIHDIAAPTTITITDITGRIVATTTSTDTTYSTTLPHSGIYIIHIANAYQKQIFKTIIQ